VTSWLAADEKKSRTQSIQSGDEDAVKAMKAVGECLAVVYRSTACLSWTNDSSVYTAVRPGSVGVKYRWYVIADVVPRRTQVGCGIFRGGTGRGLPGLRSG
jgi:hypothetical protein